MKYKTKTVLPIIGMAILIVIAAIAVATGDADEVKHPLPATLTNLVDVKMVEIKDSSDQVILSGSFSAPTQTGGELERKAALTSAGVDSDASGQAEIEVATKNGVTEQELDLEVNNLAAGASFRLFVDGQEITAFTTSPQGDAELEFSNETSK